MAVIGQIRLNGRLVRLGENNMDYESIDEYRSSVKERLARIESILQRELPENVLNEIELFLFDIKLDLDTAKKN